MSHATTKKFLSVAMVASAAMVVTVGVQSVVVAPTVASAAAPTDPRDETKVPHYFGPWPNWANSPLTLSTADVTITGAGTGAAAVAQVDPVTGGIKSIDVTSPGHDYVAGATNVSVAGSSTSDPAAATATVSTTGVVVGFTDVVPGSGYKAFDVALSGGGGTGATAIASGGVDAITITNGGSGYTMPTVDFDMPESPQGTVPKAHATIDASGTVTGVVVDEPGSGYTSAPGVTIRNGTQFDPLNFPDGGGPATVASTLSLSAVNVDVFGSAYTSAPTVAVTDPTGGGTGAGATALTDVGAVTSIAVDSPGSGYLSKGMRKFVDDLPGTCTPGGTTDACPASGKFIPNAVPAETTYDGVKADEYVIGLVQYRTQFSADLPTGTLVRGYVQLETPANAATSQHVPLKNELLDGTKVPVEGGYLGVTAPQYLGPFIGATKDKPVRITFRNLLPKGVDGDLFLPTDSSMMGSGMGPMGPMEPTNSSTVVDEVRNPACTQSPKPLGGTCFADNRATLHLHGGVTPWISDGTPHQWITPAGEGTSRPQGVSVQNVPDMTTAGAVTCEADDDGCSTFFYSNQQSARLMFYHDHSWGITRLNVYAGEAAGYAIADDTEKKLIADGVIPPAADTIPLVVQDRTFVPSDEQLYDTKDASGAVRRYGQDPTWDKRRWGRTGDFWYHHVYMPAQNPGDPSGMSAYGRWMYGPWFWPPATGTKYGTIKNPYYDSSCKLDIPSTWRYQTDPFCEPELIPGTPNISAGMEQFNDTPVVNGVAYPKVTLEPKAYRLRMLNAANDRFFNFQWYVADAAQGDGTTEVALKPAELAAAQTDPTVSPTPVDANNNAAGPDWVQIGTEGGFLPKPAVVDGQQPTTWITDPTRFDVGNVDKHSLLLAPAERADTVVDFSKFAGKTLILYNDAPAAFPARVPQYDYYTGAPDLSPAGAPSILPGYGPNTRTIMKVTIADTAAQPAYDVSKLNAAFAHKADGSGVFESGQNPIIVGQDAYDSSYGTNFPAASDCNVPGGTTNSCDGIVRVNNTGQFGFNTLKAPNSKMVMDLEPKAIHDEMNATTFDEYGRMQANLGLEAQPPAPGQQNVTLYPYVNPATELIDGTNLPVAEVRLSAGGLPDGDVKVTPIGSAKDGTQIWRFTHNGVDTHPIHFHLYDVQVLNRVAWDNNVSLTEPNELGWKDTVRMNPLQDTVVALRPIIPKVPFEVPNAIRPLNPMMPIGSTAGFNSMDPQGVPTLDPVTNELVNFGWEYVYHCHILSHEEMDMMRPESVALPPVKPQLLTATLPATGKKVVTLTWNDNSITETAFLVQRTTNGSTWTTVGTVASPINAPNDHRVRTFTDSTSNGTTAYTYRIVAENTVGYGGAFPSMTVTSTSNSLNVNAPAVTPAAPTALTATAQPGPQVALTWRDNATTETGFVIERAVAGTTTFSTVAVAPARTSTGTTTFTDTTVSGSTSYDYRVRATNVAGVSAPSNTANVSIGALAPATTIRSAVATRQGRNEQVAVAWDDVLGETGYRIQWSATADFATVAGSGTTAAGVVNFQTGNLARQAWYFRVGSVNAVGTNWSAVRLVPGA
ncbi:hypothetical protein N798_05235 [Knoellia flava TL1]|uniref:Fibronectin type-III domain-containing protein n=2 Tax=Knoellia flava TaxID=913969 RepID=A0A8H9KUQ6_9MICO|nr:multicopper oxidase domain-containing protein [Knoellia flava]KGN34048.1 hypothetical protein N798_05235 [Knoellia flava TL1]GGB83375.1 hypothetical protein GCM10011314_23770 [Knoellia flava]